MGLSRRTVDLRVVRRLLLNEIRSATLKRHENDPSFWLHQFGLFETYKFADGRPLCMERIRLRWLFPNIGSTRWRLRMMLPAWLR